MTDVRPCGNCWHPDCTDCYPPKENRAPDVVRDLQRARELIQCLLDNDPNADAADAVSVLDVWRKEAREFLGRTQSTGDRGDNQPDLFATGETGESKSVTILSGAK